jgi:pilus assembly protein CpaB
MDRIRLVAVMLVALAAGSALAFGTYRYLQNVPVQTVSLPTRPVVVAAMDLQLGSELNPDHLKVVDWPASAVPDGAFSQPSELAGRGLLVSVIRHEPIIGGKLVPIEAGSGLPSVIPTGMRAVSVRVNEVIGVAGYVLPGTRVDVLATASPSEQRGDMTSKVVLANVQVVTAGTRMEQAQDSGQPVQVTVVTLLVSPEQSERLALASTEGKIQLALRHPLDDSAPETPGIKPAVLLGTARPPAPRAAAPRPGPAPAVQAAAPPPPTVEIIRGDQRANEVVR